MMTAVHEWLWDAAFVRAGSFLTTNNVITWIAGLLFAGFRGFVRLTPSGFVAANGRIRARHAFAQLQLLFSLLVYVGLFVLKSYSPALGGGEPRIPTLCLLLVLAMLACWALA